MLQYHYYGMSMITLRHCSIGKIHMKKEYIQSALLANRAEEYGHDVWEHFVIPLFYEDIDLLGARKARIIRGGRGCGKTMLLRYLSHQSQFSQKRDFIPCESLNNIGIYWRSDTSFSAGLKGWGIEEEVWKSAFEHALTLKISREILAALINIASSNYEGINSETLESINFDQLAIFDEECCGNVYEICEALKNKNNYLQTWVNNPKTMEFPRFLPPSNFLSELIAVIQTNIEPLSESIFYIYIDEYENLQLYQQRVINTWTV